MGLGGLQKQTALRLIEGLEIELRGGADVSVRFLTVVPFFKARPAGVALTLIRSFSDPELNPNPTQTPEADRAAPN